VDVKPPLATPDDFERMRERVADVTAFIQERVHAAQGVGV
jgi:hypothetical protein